MIISEIKLNYIPSNKNLKTLGFIKDPRQAYNFLYKLFDKETIGLYETFIVVFLNKSFSVIGYNIHSIGGIDKTTIDIRLIVATALSCGSTSLVVAHNHPSGNIDPSIQDIKITNQLNCALDLFDIHLLDHLIIAPEKDKYTSFVAINILN